MKFNKLLNHVFSGPSQIAVLRALYLHKSGISGRETSRIAGISPKAALQALTGLEILKIVNRVIGGRDHLFTLNRENYIVKNGIIPLLNSENSMLDTLLANIKKHISKYSLSIILFGSVARGEEISSSDLDILIVIKETVSEKEVFDKLALLRSGSEEVYGVHISPLILTLKKFRKLYKSDSVLIKSLRTDGKVIYGKNINGLLNDAQNKQNKG